MPDREIIDNGHFEEFRVFMSPGNSGLWKDLAVHIARELETGVNVSKARTGGGSIDMEKLDEETEGCNFAILILTPEDRPADDPELALRNIAHEIGFCQGKFGTDNVLLLIQDGTDLHIDIPGVTHTTFVGGEIESVFSGVVERLENAMNRFGMIYFSDGD